MKVLTDEIEKERVIQGVAAERESRSGDEDTSIDKTSINTVEISYSDTLSIPESVTVTELYLVRTEVARRG